MIERGMARVYSFADNRMMISEMLNLEGSARDADRGIWRDAYYHVRNVTESEAFEDQFEIVTGRVLETALVRGRAYLNFGDNYRTDFTITISPKDMRAFRKDGIELGIYDGRLVRVRGWIEMLNGPMIEVTHPEQIELLDE